MPPRALSSAAAKLASIVGEHVDSSRGMTNVFVEAACRAGAHLISPWFNRRRGKKKGEKKIEQNFFPRSLLRRQNPRFAPSSGREGRGRGEFLHLCRQLGQIALVRRSSGRSLRRSLRLCSSGRKKGGLRGSIWPPLLPAGRESLSRLSSLPRPHSERKPSSYPKPPVPRLRIILHFICVGRRSRRSALILFLGIPPDSPQTTAFV
jgi:hypothetical protein